MKGAAVAGVVVLAVALSGGAAAQEETEAAYACNTPIAAGPVTGVEQPPDADVVAAFRKAIQTERANPVEQLALWEAGLVESGLKNLTYGDADSLGALQERVSIYGRAHALDPYASGRRFLRDAKALRPWGSTPGLLAAGFQRPREDLRGRYDAEEPAARKYLDGDGAIGTPVSQDACSLADGPLPGADEQTIAGLKGIVFLNPAQKADMLAGGFDPRFLAVLRYIGEHHTVVLTALRHDHAPGTNHEAGRATDIGIVDGKLCNPYGPSDPCGKLLIELSRLPAAVRPTELIGGFDPDGSGPAWAQADHRDHLHVAMDAGPVSDSRAGHRRPAR